MVIGIVINAHGEVLIAQRSGDQFLSGYWEFPGGKVEPGERYEAALARELSEEVGLTIQQATPFMQLEHQYSTRQVRLRVYTVNDWSCDALGAVGKEGQPIQWCPLRQLSQFQFPEANTPIVHRMRLARAIAISPDHLAPNAAGIAYLCQWVESNLHSNVNQFYLRLPKFSLSDLAHIGAELAQAYKAQAIRLIVPSQVWAQVAKQKLMLPDWVFGVQFSSADLVYENNNTKSLIDVCRQMISQPYMGASCHSRYELQVAEQLGFDYALLSPVLQTQTHPDREPLGWKSFNELNASVWMPCFALGGLSKNQVDHALQCGAYGVAGISMYSD